MFVTHSQAMRLIAENRGESVEDYVDRVGADEAIRVYRDEVIAKVSSLVELYKELDEFDDSALNDLVSKIQFLQIYSEEYAQLINARHPK